MLHQWRNSREAFPWRKKFLIPRPDGKFNRNNLFIWSLAVAVAEKVWTW